MARLFGGKKFDRDSTSYYGNAQELLSKPIFAEITALQDQVLVTETAEAVARRLAAAHVLRTPRLRPNEITFDETLIEVKDPLGTPKPGTQICYFIPFDGRGDVLEFGVPGIDERDQRFKHCEVINNEIVVQYKTTTNDPHEIKTQFATLLEAIQSSVQSLEYAVTRYNEAIKAEAQKRIQARINLLTKQDWEKALGYPRRQAKS